MTAIDVYRALLSRGALPVLTLYGSSAGAPRLELSGKVVANHVAKAANFLVDDLMIDAGSNLELDLPSHWRLITWGLGGLLAGATVGFEDGETLVTTDPSGDADEVIAVSLGALDLSYPGDLPAGVTDGNGEVLSQPDILLDETLGADSNAADFQVDLPEGSGRLLLVDPTPQELLSTFLSALQKDWTLVVADADWAEKAEQVEGAVRLPRV